MKLAGGSVERDVCAHCGSPQVAVRHVIKAVLGPGGVDIQVVDDLRVGPDRNNGAGLDLPAEPIADILANQPGCS